MTVKVHALVENPDDLDLVFQYSKEDDVGADRVFAIASSKLVAWPSPPWFTNDLFDAFFQKLERNVRPDLRPI